MHELPSRSNPLARAAPIAHHVPDLDPGAHLLQTSEYEPWIAGKRFLCQKQEW